MNGFRPKAILMLVIFLVIAPSTLAMSIPSVKSDPDEDEKETIYHSGDFVVEGGKTYVIENKTFFIDGNLIVKDRSTLIIRNSKIILQLKFFGEYWVTVRDFSRLLVDNATLGRTDHHLTIFTVRPGSEVIIKNAVCGWDLNPDGKIVLENYDASSACNGIFFHGGKITAVNSTFNIISIPISGKNKYTLELNNLKPGFLEHVLIERNRGTAYLELLNSTVGMWAVDIGDPVNPSFVDLVVRDSRLWGLWIWFRLGTDVKLSNIRPGLYYYWRMSEVWHLDGVGYDIELVNTSIEMFKLQIVGNALIENVSGVQVATRGPSFAHVKNSTIQVNLILRGNEHVILEDTEVQGSIIQLIEDRSDLQYSIGLGGAHHLEFNRATIKVPFEIASNYTKIEGEVTIFVGLDEVNWVFGIVEREFPVIVEFEGNPYPNAPLNLFDSSGSLIWKGKTDENGAALFNLTFMKENYTEKYRFFTKSQNRTISRKIGFLSDTPVVFSFGEHCTDGDLGDWKAMSPLMIDERGDSLAEYGDLRAIYATLDYNHLYIAVEIYDGGVEKTAENLIVEIDSDLDGRRDYVIDAHSVRNEETHEVSQIVESAVDRVIELRVPLESIGNPDEFNIGAHTIYQISGGEHAASDKMEGWALISRRSSISIDVSSSQILYGGNLTVSGEISPSKIGAPVTLTYQMPNGSLFTKNVTSTDMGAFNFIFRPDVVGSWSVKASWEGDPTHNGASSQTTSFTVVETEPKPAKFEVSDLVISPEEVQEGEEVRISVRVTNAGEESYGHTIDLKVDGETMDLEDVTLVGGDSKTVTFTIIEDVGDHTVEVGNLSGSFKVMHKPSFWDEIPGFPYESIILGLAIGALILWILKHKS